MSAKALSRGVLRPADPVRALFGGARGVSLRTEVSFLPGSRPFNLLLLIHEEPKEVFAVFVSFFVDAFADRDIYAIGFTGT